MTRRVSFVATAAALAVLSGLMMALPLASAATSVAVSIPNGAGVPNSGPGYAPATVTVVIGVNNTVTWTNNDIAAHTVTPATLPAGATWSVGSGNMPANGAVYSFTFTVPGTYTYGCAYHGWMMGTVIVKAGTTPTPEFPVASLAIILFAVIAAIVVAAPRLRPSLSLP
jgi:plastocyanin